MYHLHLPGQIVKQQIGIDLRDVVRIGLDDDDAIERGVLGRQDGVEGAVRSDIQEYPARRRLAVRRRHMLFGQRHDMRDALGLPNPLQQQIAIHFRRLIEQEHRAQATLDRVAELEEARIAPEQAREPWIERSNA